MIRSLLHYEPFNITTIAAMLRGWLKVDRTCVGSLLLRANLIQRSELEVALQRAKETRTQIGQALVSLGLISEDTICQTLRVQQLLREGAIDQQWAEIALHLGLETALI